MKDPQINQLAKALITLSDLNKVTKIAEPIYQLLEAIGKDDGEYAIPLPLPLVKNLLCLLPILIVVFEDNPDLCNLSGMEDMQKNFHHVVPKLTPEQAIKTRELLRRMAGTEAA
jgi:hypothetical protein